MRVGAGAGARRAGRVGRSVGFYLGIMGPIGAPGAQGTPTLCAAWLVWRVPVPGLNRQHEADHVVIFCCCCFLLRRMSLLRCRCFLGGASSVRIRPRPGGRAKALPGRARWVASTGETVTLQLGLSHLMPRGNRCSGKASISTKLGTGSHGCSVWPASAAACTTGARRDSESDSVAVYTAWWLTRSLQISTLL